jgi:hypothetical protein
MHDGDVDAWDVKLLHAREQGRARGWLAFDDDRRGKAALDLVNEVVCAGGSLGLR